MIYENFLTKQQNHLKEESRIYNQFFSPILEDQAIFSLFFKILAIILDFSSTLFCSGKKGVKAP